MHTPDTHSTLDHPHDHPEDDVRVVLWNVYCPRCLHLTQNFRHVGTEQMTRRITCEQCLKSYAVTTRVDGQNMARCSATPVFIRSPEITQDNDPPAIYR